MAVSFPQSVKFVYDIKLDKNSKEKGVIWNYEYRMVTDNNHFLELFSEKELSDEKRKNIVDLTGAYLGGRGSRAITKEDYTKKLISLYSVRRIRYSVQTEDDWRIGFPQNVQFIFNADFFSTSVTDISMIVYRMEKQYKLTSEAKNKLDKELTQFVEKTLAGDTKLIKDIALIRGKKLRRETPDDYTTISKYLLVQLSVLKQLKEQVSEIKTNDSILKMLEAVLLNIELHMRYEIPDRGVSFAQLRDALGLEEVDHEKFDKIFINGNVTFRSFIDTAIKITETLLIPHLYSLDFLNELSSLIKMLKCHDLRTVVELNSSSGALSFFLEQVGVKVFAFFINPKCDKLPHYLTEKKHLVREGRESKIFERYAGQSVLYICSGCMEDSLLKVIAESEVDLCFIFIGYQNMEVFNGNTNVKVRELDFSTFPKNYSEDKIRLLAVNYEDEAWEAIMSTVSQLQLAPQSIECNYGSILIDNPETKDVIRNYEYRMLTNDNHFLEFFSEKELSNAQRKDIFDFTMSWVHDAKTQVITEKDYENILGTLYSARLVGYFEQTATNWRLGFPKNIEFHLNDTFYRNQRKYINLVVSYIAKRHDLTSDAEITLKKELKDFYEAVILGNVNLIGNIATMSMNEFYKKTPDDYTTISKRLLVLLSILKQLKQRVLAIKSNDRVASMLAALLFNVESHIKNKIPDEFVSFTQLRDALGLEEVKHGKFDDIFINGNVICRDFIETAYKILYLLQMGFFYSRDFLQQLHSLTEVLRRHRLVQLVEFNSLSGALSFFLEQVGVKISVVFINNQTMKLKPYPHENISKVDVGKACRIFKSYEDRKVLYICSGQQDDDMLKVIAESKIKLCFILIGHQNMGVFNGKVNVKVRELGFSTFPKNYSVDKIRLLAVNYEDKDWKAIMGTISGLEFIT